MATSHVTKQQNHGATILTLLALHGMQKLHGC
uniref:Uncharacterized protein n=1 Tax=Setaria italica TaxID=4555 RepID=K3XUL0_SETIT